MQQSIYVGLDLGSSRCHQTVINADGALQMSRSIPTSEQHLRLAFSALGDNVRVHLESGELADWVSSVIKPRPVSALSPLAVLSLISKLRSGSRTKENFGDFADSALRAASRTAKDWLIRVWMRLAQRRFAENL